MSTTLTANDLLSSIASNLHDGDMSIARRAIINSLGNPIIESADMYKTTHKDMYPQNMTKLQSYCEPRTGASLNKIVVFGIQLLVNDLASIRVTQAQLNEADKFFASTFKDPTVFARLRPGWQTIIDAGGYLPVEIRALPEGMVVPPGTPIFTVESTNEATPWIANFLETRLSHFWYTATVASIAFYNRQTLEKMCILEGMTVDEASHHAKHFGVCDFGLRGVPNIATGAAGGMAALTSSHCSDNSAAIFAFASDYGTDDSLSDFYENIGSSIPAAEHSTITAHLKSGELDAVRQILTKFPSGPISIVADSYDYIVADSYDYNGFVGAVCGELKSTIMDRYEAASKDGGAHMVVIRPDSGDMHENVVFTLKALKDAFGSEQNAMGFHVLHPAVRIIQGDGINMESYAALLDTLHKHSFSVTNLVCGSGGGLLQNCNRDTLRFAIKANLAIIDGTERGLAKETAGKTSKRGRLAVEVKDEEVETFSNSESGGGVNLLDELVYRDGKRMRFTSIQQIRSRIDKAHSAMHTEAKASSTKLKEDEVADPNATSITGETVA